MPTEPKEQWTITFVPAPGDYPPMTQRIKRMLKSALRSYGLRCIRLGETDTTQDTKGNDDA